MPGAGRGCSENKAAVGSDKHARDEGRVKAVPMPKGFGLIASKNKKGRLSLSSDKRHGKTTDAGTRISHSCVR